MLSLQAVMALRQLSDRNIVHADIKGENMIISTDGVLKVIDLGLAMIDGGMIGHGGGTDDYIPEETYDYGISTSKRDVYALGVTLAKLLDDVDPTEEGFDWASCELVDFMGGCFEEKMEQRYSVDQLEMVSFGRGRKARTDTYLSIPASICPGAHR